MNKYTRIMGLLALLLGTTSVHAQKKNAYTRLAESIVERYADSLAQAGQAAVAPANNTEQVNMSPLLYRLVGPGIYYHSALTERFRLDYTLPTQRGSQPIATEGMAYRDAFNAEVNHLLQRTYVDHPSSFRYHDTQIASERIVAPAVMPDGTKEDLEQIYNQVDEISDVTDVLGDVDISLRIEKPNFWTTRGKFSFQFTQNYFSENWYKGGDNNVTLLSNLLLEANYNDQRRIQWDNKLDLRLGFITATADSCHSYLTNNDKIQLSSKLGVKATKSWFYTAMVEANTQFLPGYKSNDRRAYSKFLAPLDIYVSLGMDFKPQLGGDRSLSVALLPLSYKARYIGVDEETIISSYNMKHHDFQQDFGSKIEVNAQLPIVKGLTWKCRSYYFTSYHYVEAELENVLTFQFNKYIASEIYTLWRFDDNRSMDFYDHTLGFFQFKEYFTLGLSYNF